MNNDGYNDILTADQSDNAVSIYRGKSSHDWESRISKSVGLTPCSVFVGDANNDGIAKKISAKGADVTLTGEAASNLFGFSVSNAGDVNNTGYDDIIVGAPGSDSAYIFCGNASMDSSIDASNANVTLTGIVNTNFGWSVSNCSDINADGSYDDVIVGAPNSTNGNAYIYYGDVLMDSASDVTLTGEGAGDKFGYSVSCAGDIDCDGGPEVVIGAPYHTDGGRAACGAIYIFFGGSGMDSTADYTYYGESAGDHFGWSVGFCGDIDKDSLQEVIVGAPDFNNDAGKAYVLYETIIPEFPILILPMILIILLAIVRKNISIHSIKKKKRIRKR